MGGSDRTDPDSGSQGEQCTPARGDTPGIDRRTFLKGTFAATGALAGVSTTADPTSTQESADWPMFQRDAANTGHNEVATPPASISTAWEKTGLDVSYENFAAVSEGTAYVVYGSTSSASPALHALSVEDGTERWDAPFDPADGAVAGTPAVANGRVIIGGADLYGVDAADGSRLWTLETSGGWLSKPTVVDQTAFVGAGDTVYAVDASSGVPRWSTRLRSLTAAPAVAGDRVFVHADRTTYALDRFDGSVLWSATHGRSRSSLAVVDDTVVTASDNWSLYAFRAADGSVRWKRTSNSGEASYLAVSHGRVYVVVADSAGPSGLYAYDIQTGDRLWENNEFGKGEGEPPPKPIVAGDTLLVGDVVGSLHVVDPETGLIRSSYEIGGNVSVNPMITGERICVTCPPNLVGLPEETKFSVLDVRSESVGLTIRGEGESTNYEFTVSEALRPDPDAGELEDDIDQISGTIARGWVTDPEHVDGFRFDGQITGFHFREGEATVELDGDEVDPDALGKRLPNVLTIRGAGEPANYEFSVSEWLASNPELGELELDNDEIDGTTASGWVTDPEHVDSFRFAGELIDFRFHEGEARVFVNDEEVEDPGPDGDAPDLPRELRIRGDGETANYLFTVDGDLEANPSEGGLEEHDEINCSTATGFVTDPEHVDSFRFDGEMVQFSFREGEATVELDGEEVDDPESLGDGVRLPNVLTVQGTGESTNYEFSVSGDLASNPDAGGLERWDELGCGTGNGWVTDPEHRDSYQFSGSVTDFRFHEGEARVFLNGEEVGDPESLG